MMRFGGRFMILVIVSIVAGLGRGLATWKGPTLGFMRQNADLGLGLTNG